ncbi:hypothetical protein E2C01_078673 [Portunus trituberculatus]|uniref:Uncharacterized protein n=1 Tax=Portunus trituberculatus TaxID=210409 RepID=A0A5B7IHI0_PORTR|nr:hypothetical protein [Portunus trituberculatus]
MMEHKATNCFHMLGIRTQDHSTASPPLSLARSAPFSFMSKEDGSLITRRISPDGMACKENGGRKEARKEGKKEGRKEGRKEGSE